MARYGGRFIPPPQPLQVAPWGSWRNLQWQTYMNAMPEITELPDVGHTSDSTFSFEAVVAAQPDLVQQATLEQFFCKLHAGAV